MIVDEEESKGEGDSNIIQETATSSNTSVITSEQVRYYQWDDEMTEKAKELIKTSEELKQAQVTENMYNKYEKDAKRNWDLFYKVNKTNFYKDRHYIKLEFMEMADTMTSTPADKEFTLLDAGCGVGNGFYPLFREYPGRLKVHCCDFSPRAVEFAKKHELYNAERIDANVCDLVNDE